MIPHSFWKDVEKPMKYVQYGDSVAGEEKSIVRFKGKKPQSISFNDIWDMLVGYGYDVTIIEDKEYIFNPEKLQVMTYTELSLTTYYTMPKYIMRHKIIADVKEILFSKSEKLVVTNDHSMLEYNDRYKSLIKVKPDELVNSLFIDYSNMSFHNNPVINIESIKYSGYVYDFEVPETHNFIANGVVVHNTDSLYISLDTEETTTEGMVAETDVLSKAINDQIIYFIESFLLPRLGVDIAHNHTFFKTELVADAILFLDIKKNYAFRELANNGKIHKSPIIKYTGIPVVRNNIAKFTKDFIRAITENIALDLELSKIEMKKQLQIVAKEYWGKLQLACDEFDFEDIGIPCKWGSNYKQEPFQVTGMRTYNTISKTDSFTPSSSGIVIPVIVKNQSKFTTMISDLKDRTKFCLGRVPISKVTYLALPYNRDQEKTKQLLSEFGLSIDVTEYWGVLYNTVARRIVDAVKGA